MANKNVEMKPDEFSKLKAQQDRVVGSYAARDAMFTGFKEIYFMSTGEGMSDREQRDVKMTVSAAERNAVVGMTRLLKTSTPAFEGLAKNAQSDKLEDALKEMWDVSGEVRRASLSSDGALSAVLFGPVAYTVENVDDLLLVTKDQYDKALLEEIRKRTPMLFRTINAENSYPVWGNYGIRSHLHKYEATVAEIRERWGEAAVRGEKDDDKLLVVMDYYGPVWRVVWIEGEKEPIFAKRHGMPRIPIAIRYAGGSSLFAEPERQLQSFLYGAWKGELHKRKNLLLTTLFTSIFERGTGPLFSIDPDVLSPDGELVVNHAGALRYIVGKAQLLNDKAYDRDLLEVSGMLDQMSDESTIYPQALGQNMGNNTPFSSIALLSRNGQLPLNDPIEAMEQAIKDISVIALQWIKREGIANDLIAPSEIPDDLRLKVLLKPKLPQDDLRNAQVAAQIGDKVSDEWIHTNLLQIGDSKAMMKQVYKEQAIKSIFGAMVKDPQFLSQMLQMVVSDVGNATLPSRQIPGQPNMERVPLTEPVGEM